MDTTKVHRTALLFNASKIFDDEVIAGIAACFGSTRAAWHIFLDFLEEDFRLRLSGIEHWQGGDTIANFDDPAVAEALSGGSYADPANYPAGVPYVATDNIKLIELAAQHLIDVGLQRFAMFGVPVKQVPRHVLGRSRHAERGGACGARGWRQRCSRTVPGVRGGAAVILEPLKK